MGNRCESCGKFSALNFEDPEVNSFDCEPELDATEGTLSGTAKMDVRIYRTRECCGDEAKEANIEAEEEFSIDHETLKDHIAKNENGEWDWKDGHGLKVSEDDPEQIEEGGGRYAKSFFGASLHYVVECDCGAQFHEGTLEDKVPASGMDEL